MEILLNGFGAYEGGVARVHHQLLAGLGAHGRVSVAAAPRDQRPLPGVTVLSRQSDSRRDSALADLRASSRRRRFDLRIDSAPAFRPNTPAAEHVAVVHDLGFRTSSRAAREVSRGQYLYRLLLHHWTLRRVDRVVVVSESTRDEVVEFLPRLADRVQVVPLPLDHLPDVPRPATRPGPGPHGPVRLLTFGHAPHKGVDHLLALLAHRPDCELTVVCSPDAWERHWAPVAHRLGVADRTRIRSDLDDRALVAEYDTCHVFCLLSAHEGYGLPVAEALTRAVPVVVSDLPVLRSTSRGYAVAVGPHDVAAVSRAVDEALARPIASWEQAAAALGGRTWVDFAAEVVHGPGGSPQRR